MESQLCHQKEKRNRNQNLYFGKYINVRISKWVIKSVEKWHSLESERQRYGCIIEEKNKSNYTPPFIWTLVLAPMGLGPFGEHARQNAHFPETLWLIVDHSAGNFERFVLQRGCDLQPARPSGWWAPRRTVPERGWRTHRRGPRGSARHQLKSGGCPAFRWNNGSKERSK